MAGEEAIFGIGLEQIGAGARGLAIGGGEENFFDERFAAVAEAAEFGGEKIEKLGVSGFFAADAEIVGGGDEGAAEEVKSDVVDEDAIGEGVGGVGEPVGEVEARE